VELPNGVRPFILAIYFLVASVLLYFGIAIPMIAPGGYHESRFELAIPYLTFVLPGLLVTFRIAWVLRRPASVESKGRPLWLTLLFSVGGASLGAVLLSVLIWRHYWVRLFWDR
jgi:hypothetical protein